jgi:superfamily II DNA or RNA helicase
VKNSPPSINHSLRHWQSEAIEIWKNHGYRGIVGAVTGGGKTVFALACIENRRPGTALIVVPTIPLLDQWWEEAASYFGLGLDEVNIIQSRGRLKPGTINIGVLNSVSKMEKPKALKDLMLVVDECHKAASPEFRSSLAFETEATLGLSATPERPYDDGLSEVLVPALGSVIYQYSYADALRDGVIVPFVLKNVVFDLEEDRAEEYARLSKIIGRMISQYGVDASETIAVYLRRSRLLNRSPRRVEVALRIAAFHRGLRTLIFHEDIESCEVIAEVLRQHGMAAKVYHSKLPLRIRAETLSSYRLGETSVLVTCRALDEGFNVPETEIGIIAASTATRRQRIQRLGRALRPSVEKTRALIYTLVATEPEIRRLQSEEEELEGVADVTWAKA